MGHVFPPQSYTAWEVGLTIVQVLAVSTTLFRLYHRIRERRMWFDDYVIVIPLLADCIGFGVQWERMKKRFPPPRCIMESFWIMIVFFMTVLWISRMSLAFSIARLFPRRPEKKFGVALGILCLVCCLATLGITAVTCRPKDHRPWYMMDARSCIRSGNGHIIGGLSLLSIEVGSDLILTGYPLFVLWRVRLPKSQRRIIMAALSGSILTIMATIVLAVFWYNTWDLGPDAWLISTGVANIESAIGLMNLHDELLRDPPMKSLQIDQNGE
ncbi:hypothetical protein BJ165DRAFT_1108195 [Panaeolus papilionaceus]|nr:hypothetical protein BJ165DRAFT_1108195 [Panaeolus papilionaceus]